MAKATGLGVILATVLLWGAASVFYDSARTGDVAMSQYPLPRSDLPLLDNSATAPAENLVT